MNDCKKCNKLQKKISYPDDFPGYNLLIKSETFSVYQCQDCGRYIKNEHKRYGFQTEYLPFNSVIGESEYQELKVLNTLSAD